MPGCADPCRVVAPQESGSLAGGRLPSSGLTPAVFSVAQQEERSLARTEKQRMGTHADELSHLFDLR